MQEYNTTHWHAVRHKDKNKSKISNSKLLTNKWKNLLRKGFVWRYQCSVACNFLGLTKQFEEFDLNMTFWYTAGNPKRFSNLWQRSTFKSICHWLLRGWFANKGIKEPSHFHNLDQNNALFPPNWNVSNSGWQSLIKFHLVVRNSNSRCQSLVHNVVWMI